MLEFTSSGLSHVVSDWLYQSDSTMGLLQTPDVSLSPVLDILNYGLLEIPLQPDSQIAFTGSIKDIHGHTLEQFSATHSDISFNKMNTRFPKICEAKWDNQQTFRMFLHLSSEMLVYPRNSFAYRRLFICVLPTVSLLAAGFIRLAKLLFTRR